MGWFVLAGLVIVFGVGCVNVANKTMPLASVTDFWTEDPKLYQAMVRAAKIWTSVGVANASLVTVTLLSKVQDENWKKKGKVPIVRAPREKMVSTICKQKGDGCSTTHNQQWNCIYIPEDLVDQNRLNQVMLHELGHIVAQAKDHSTDGVPAVMEYHGTSYLPTDEDVAYMSARTLVLPIEDIVPDVPEEDTNVDETE